MTAADSRRAARFASRARLLALGAMVLGMLAGPVAAQDPGETGPEVWLVTYGPGQIYWQRFGHNAIWIRDADLGLDHTFNFGFFDFEQEDFFLRFLQGRMLYFSAAQPASREFAQYIDENRSIRAQRLALPPDRALALADFLVEEVQPKNRDYLYDYYLDNCSTRVRDALDRALGGELLGATADVAAGQNFREHTRRLAQGDFWLYLGLEVGLGAPVDRPISRWEEFFIPGELAEGVAALEVAGLPVVVEDVVIHESMLPPPPERPARTWPRYLLASLALLALAAVAARLSGPVTASGLARTWLGIAGVAGGALVFFWVGTDHSVAATNLNLLVFNPLWLLVLAGRRLDRAVAALVLICGLAGLAAQALPPHQYTADVLAAFLPLNFAAAWTIGRRSRG